MVQLYSTLHQNILDVFTNMGWRSLTPLTSATRRSRKSCPKDQWYAAPATPPAQSTQPDPAIQLKL